jgi:hypothetical protein
MWRFLIAMCLIPCAAVAQDHEYQFIQIKKEAATYTQGIIIDSKTGDLWEYLNQPASGASKFVEGVKYLGKLHPCPLQKSDHTPAGINEYS